MCGSLVYIV